MKKNITISLFAFGLIVILSNQVFASEIIGTLNSTAGNPSGTLNGNVISGSASGQSTNGGSGGGGSIVVPSAAYSSGGNSNVILGTHPTVGEDKSSYTGMGGIDYSRINPTRKSRLAQAVSNQKTQRTLDPATYDATTTATITTPLIQTENIATVANSEDTLVTQSGPFDFFGISVWFWLIILVLIILIIPILYMQSL